MSRGDFSVLKFVSSPRQKLVSPIYFSLIVVESNFPTFQCHAVVVMLLLPGSVLLSSFLGWFGLSIVLSQY